MLAITSRLPPFSSQNQQLHPTANNPCNHASNKTPISHRKTQIMSDSSLSSSDITQIDLESPDPDRDIGLSKKKSSKKPKNDNDGSLPTETDASIRHQQTAPQYSQTKGLSPSNADGSQMQPTKDPITSHAPLPSEQEGRTSSPIEAEDVYWQPMDTVIQSGIEELASTVLPIPARASELISPDMECQDEDLENDQGNGTPLDVDAIDSDLNHQGFPLNRAPLEELSSASYESGENYFTPDEAPSGKYHTDDSKHDSSLPLEEIYEQKIPVLKLSQDAYGCPSDISLDQEDDTPELLISLYPHGILQALLLLYPAAAIRVIKCRLEMLSKIDDADLEKLRENLKQVEDDIQNRNQHFALLRNLKAFECKHDLYSLQSKMDADFLVRKGRISSNLLATPVEEVESNKFRDPQFGNLRTWPRVMGWWCKRREYILRGAIRRLGEKKLESSRQLATAELEKSSLVKVSVARGDIGKKDILNQYIQEQPETIKRLLTYLVCFNVKCQQSIRKIQATKVVLAIDQLEQTPESIRALLERLVKQNLLPEIEKQLEDEVYWHHSIRLEYELKSSKTAVSLPALLDQRQHFLNLESINHQRTSPPADRSPSALNIQGNRVSAQLIHLFLAAQPSSKGPSPKESDLFPPWYFLKQPSVQHIQTVLAQTEDSPEKSFYLATLKFIDALSHVKTDNRYERDLHWMQCYYHVAFYEQQLLIHLIEKSEPHPLLPYESFEQNISVLWQLGKARKKIGYLPLNPDSYAYYLSYLNFVWQEEDEMEDIIAELYRKRYLKLLEYNPCTEFKNLFYDTVKWGTPAIRSIATNAWQLIQKFRSSGSSDLLNTLYQEGKGLISLLFSAKNPVHSLITETLGTMLEVAQQCPKFFRVMWGDFALLMPQLESLLGQEASVSGLLERISVCMRGQALALIFSGDKPLPLDFDPTQNPRFATFIKRFQLLRDIISALHAGLPVIEIFLCRNVKDLESSLRKVTWNTLSTYLARQCASKMKPPMLRLCNSLRHAQDLMPSLSLGLSSNFLASISPDNIVNQAHHIGRRSGMVTGAISFLLTPFITRFEKYKEKINKVKADPLNTEARNELQSERKKVAGILLISSTLSTIAILFMNAFKIIVFVGSPILTTAIIGVSTFLCIGCVVARRYNQFDEVWTSINETVSERMKRTFAKDSPGAIEASKRIHDISKTTLDNMAEIRQQALSGWNIWRSNKLRIELSQYWNQLQYKEEILQHIKARIKEKHHPDLQQDAKHILNFVKAKALVEKAMKDPDSLSANPDRFSDFNQQLTGLFFSPLDASVLPYQLQYLIEEIHAFLEFSCGTVSPGEDVETIISTLEAHNIELHKGDHVFNILHMRHIRSSLLNTRMADSLQSQDEQASDGEDNENKLLPPLPDVHDARAILTDAMQKCDDQQLQKEQQAREARMVIVNKRALLECLKNYTASSIPNLSTSPLFKSNLEIQIRELERASKPWLVDETRQPSQKQDSDQPLYGCTYNAMEACKEAVAKGSKRSPFSTIPKAYARVSTA